MQFLAPLFLAAIAALAVPVWLHLRRERPKDRVAFSAVMFLDPVVPHTTRRRKLDNLLLLLLRCLGLALLILAFARPFFASNEIAGLLTDSGTTRLILIDTSASLRDDRFAAVRDAAERVIRETEPADTLAIATFDRALQPVISFEAWERLAPAERISQATQAVRTLEPGWAGTNLGDALTGAAELLAAETGRTGTPAELSVISDFQRGAATDALEGYAWPPRLQIVPIAVGAPPWTNGGVNLLSRSNRQPGAGSNEPQRVRVTNAADSVRSDFVLQWSEPGATPSPIRVEPGENALFAAPPDATATRGSVTLTGDDFPFDNSAWFAVDPPRVAYLDYWGDADANDPEDVLFFLQRAMQPAANYTMQIRPRGADATASPPDAEPMAALAVIDGSLSPAGTDTMRKFLESGGTALMVMRENGDSTLPGTLAGAVVPVTEATLANNARFGEIAFDDPVFAPFADPRFGDFSRIPVWKFRTIDTTALPAATVMARFDSGEAALLRVPVGSGHLYVLTTSWAPADSQLALSSKFAPLLHSILEQSPQLAPRKANYTIGDAVTLPAGVPETVTRPDGSTAEAPGGTFSAIDLPGIYTAGDFAFAVNVPAAESELSPLGEPELRALGLPLEPVEDAAAAAQRQLTLATEEAERRQKVWWWLILAGMAVFLLETLAAARLEARRNATPEAA